MEFCQFAEFLDQAKKKEIESLVREQWLQLVPLMATKEIKYIPFEEMLAKVQTERADTRSIEDIEAEIERARERYERS